MVHRLALVVVIPVAGGDLLVQPAANLGVLQVLAYDYQR